ncbi:DUF3071 domain-containing protein [Arthrobacter stackebrandtii]|nr:DUF3071 domain-containing protein [Arthrobacter stackebrandtii]
MAELRLVGVHDDGGHLLLSGPNGDNYLLPLDEALRSAVGKGQNRTARAPSQAAARMSPREIQSMIRAGSTAADVAEASGHSIDQIRRYEGPVLAERDYIANQARTVEVAAAAPHNDVYRAAFGDEAIPLEAMVRHRLAAFGIDPKSLRWDAWREGAGAWTIAADFEPGTEWAANSIGEPAPALWHFHSGRKSLQNANRWAQQLSELEPLDSPVPERRLSAVADQPFDVEANGGEPAVDPAGAPEDDPESPDFPGHGLLEMLRSRRGMRLGIDEDGDDELAAMLGSHVPGAHPRDEELYGTPAPEPEDGGGERPKAVPFLQLAPTLEDRDEPPAEPVNSVSEVSTETREVIVSGEPVTFLRPARPVAAAPGTPAATADAAPAPSHAPAEDDGPSDTEVAERLERKAAAKPKRSSVPSWDEIVFGTKGD